MLRDAFNRSVLILTITISVKSVHNTHPTQVHVHVGVHVNIPRDIETCT